MRNLKNFEIINKWRDEMSNKIQAQLLEDVGKVQEWRKKLKIKLDKY